MTALIIGIPICGLLFLLWAIHRYIRKGTRKPDPFQKVVQRILVRADDPTPGPVYFRKL